MAQGASASAEGAQLAGTGSIATCPRHRASLWLIPDAVLFPFVAGGFGPGKYADALSLVSH